MKNEFKLKINRKNNTASYENYVWDLEDYRWVITSEDFHYTDFAKKWYFSKDFILIFSKDGAYYLFKIEGDLIIKLGIKSVNWRL